MSELAIPEGNMAKKHTHAPIAQYRLRSLDERRFIILTISGIFQRGRIILAIKAILFIIIIHFSTRPPRRTRSKNIVRAKSRTMPCLQSLQLVRFYACTSLQARLSPGQDIYEDQTLSGSARILRESWLSSRGGRLNQY